jgi:hypothetical protein
LACTLPGFILELGVISIKVTEVRLKFIDLIVELGIGGVESVNSTVKVFQLIVGRAPISIKGIGLFDKILVFRYELLTFQIINRFNKAADIPQLSKFGIHLPVNLGTNLSHDRQ